MKIALRQSAGPALSTSFPVLSVEWYPSEHAFATERVMQNNWMFTTEPDGGTLDNGRRPSVRHSNATYVLDNNEGQP